MKRRPPAENSRRVRYIDGNSRFVITNKTGRTVQCESFQERKLALLLERDRTVIDYISQPEPFVYTTANGRQKTYTPDFRVTRRGEPDEIYEVTLEERRLNRPALLEREAAARQICKANGWLYRVYTETVLPDDTETANLLAFYGARSGRCANPEIREIARTELTHNKLHMADLIDRIVRKQTCHHGAVHLMLRHLIWHGILEINWQWLFYLTTSWSGKTLAPTALVWRGEAWNE